MVNYSADPLDRVFGALGDPTRRAILSRLEQQDGLAISDLAAPIPLTLPAVLKHLQVLGDAGLVTRTKRGRTVTVHLATDRLRDANEWLARYERFWTPAFDRLSAHARSRESEARAADMGGSDE